VNALIYTCAFSAYCMAQAHMWARSIRVSGWSGEIAILADHSVSCNDAEVINVIDHPSSEAIRNCDPVRLYHQRGASSIYDYQLLRMRPQDFLDTTRCDALIYTDADVLFFQSPELLVRQLTSRTLYTQRDRKMRHLLYSLRGEPPQEYLDQPGYCSGALGLMANDLDLLAPWRAKYLDNRMATECRNQPSLNTLIAQGVIPAAHFVGIGTRGYRGRGEIAVHYIPWSARTKQRYMTKDFHSHIMSSVP
jgi:hypothetical protein